MLKLIRRVAPSILQPKGGAFPSKAEMDLATHPFLYTPDHADLEEMEWNLLFSCDDTQRRQPRYSMIEDGAFMCFAFTRPYYHFWKKNLGNETFPIPIRSQQQTVKKSLHSFSSSPILAPAAKIGGELHLVRSSVLLELDKHRQNGVQFQRKRIQLLVPCRQVVRVQDKLDEYSKTITKDGEVSFRLVQHGGSKTVLKAESVRVIEAWIYEGVSSYWDPLLDAGFTFSPVATKEAKNKPWLQHYYLFK